MAYAADLKSAALRSVRVRVPSTAPFQGEIMLRRIIRFIYRYFKYEQADEYVSSAWVREHKRNRSV